MFNGVNIFSREKNIKMHSISQKIFSIDGKLVMKVKKALLVVFFFFSFLQIWM